MENIPILMATGVIGSTSGSTKKQARIEQNRALWQKMFGIKPKKAKQTTSNNNISITFTPEQSKQIADALQSGRKVDITVNIK